MSPALRPQAGRVVFMVQGSRISNYEKERHDKHIGLQGATCEYGRGRQALGQDGAFFGLTRAWIRGIPG